jgi:hypothetical protein
VDGRLRWAVLIVLSRRQGGRFRVGDEDVEFGHCYTGLARAAVVVTEPRGLRTAGAVPGPVRRLGSRSDGITTARGRRFSRRRLIIFWRRDNINDPWWSAAEMLLPIGLQNTRKATTMPMMTRVREMPSTQRTTPVVSP